VEKEPISREKALSNHLEGTLSARDIAAACCGVCLTIGQSNWLETREIRNNLLLTSVLISCSDLTGWHHLTKDGYQRVCYIWLILV
jgi:hypothetical protein